MSEHPPTMILNNPYVTCYVCRGYGLEDSMWGPTECYMCGGDCVIRDRDDKGRFITHPNLYKHIGNGEYRFVEALSSKSGLGGQDVPLPTSDQQHKEEE